MTTTREIKYIFLTGFMGAGKSTTGKHLADLLGCEFTDLDSTIVANEKRTIADIFAQDGEEYFRDCETRLLESLDDIKVKVLATGGGIVQRSDNRNLMRQKGIVIHLSATWTTLQTRLQHSVDRPLVDPAHGWAAVEQLWQKRQPYYEDADIVIETDGLTPLQTARNIVKALGLEAS